MTGIPYADEVLNCVVGCTPCSPACDHCWAKAQHDIRHKAYLADKKLPKQYAKPFSEIQLFPERLERLKHWKKPRTIFMCSTSDLFNPGVSDDFIWEVFYNMCRFNQHTYLVLTKRVDRAVKLFERWRDKGQNWFSKSIIFGITVWNQESADRDIPILLNCWPGKTWLSVEPLLSPVDPFIPQKLERLACAVAGRPIEHLDNPTPLPNYVVVGCESGKNRRRIPNEWINSIASQCRLAGVPCLLKQWETDGKVKNCAPFKDFFKNERNKL